MKIYLFDPETRVFQGEDFGEDLSLRPVRAAELAAMPGVSTRDAGQLLPFVVALPAATPLNVNTASPVVLAAGHETLAAASAAAVARILQRGEPGQF